MNVVRNRVNLGRFQGVPYTWTKLPKEPIISEESSIHKILRLHLSFWEAQYVTDNKAVKYGGIVTATKNRQFRQMRRRDNVTSLLFHVLSVSYGQNNIWLQSIIALLSNILQPVEPLYNILASSNRRHVPWCVAVSVSKKIVATPVNQTTQYWQATEPSCPVHRSVAEPVPGIHLSSGIEECKRCIQMTFSCRHM